MILNNKQITMMESKKCIALFYFICTAHIRLNKSCNCIFSLANPDAHVVKKVISQHQPSFLGGKVYLNVNFRNKAWSDLQLPLHSNITGSIGGRKGDLRAHTSCV